MEFKRLLEFCATADATTPPNDIRLYLPEALKQVPQTFEPYEKSLERLDIATWENVKQKLSSRTLKDSIRGWAQFYDTLAEVRGYCYLLDEGYTTVNFIPEVNTARTPDIEASKSNGEEALLESKCISFSDDERKYILENTRRLKTDEKLEVREVTKGMPDPLKRKIESTVNSAKGQLLNYKSTETDIKRILYLTIHLDTHMYLDMGNFTEVINFLRKLVREETDVEITIDKELSGV